MSKNQLDSVYKDLLAECESYIRSGQLQLVASLIGDLNLNHVPRAARQTLANICRRAGLIGPGLKLLHPVVRPTKAVTDEPTEKEICEYSALLARNGSIVEALDLLKDISAKLAPESLLYQGQCHIQNWDYAKAIPLFQDFLKSTAEDYSKMIARVNLIASFIVTFRLDEASELLDETIPLVEKAGATRLLGNCHELWGQVHFWKNDFAKARQSLKKASEFFNGKQMVDQLLIQKTEAIMASFEGRSAEPLIKFKQLASENNYWESVRESDLFLLKVQGNQKDLDHLYFGTPMHSYRERLEAVLNAKASHSYTYGSEKGPQIDLLSATVEGTDALIPSKNIHRVLAALVKDFYAPLSQGALFAELYPEEYFNMETSPMRLRQIVLRTRQWIEENQLPISIEQKGVLFKLHIQGEIGFRLYQQTEAIDSFLSRWHQLERAYSTLPQFTAEQACEQFGWSRTNFRRLVNWATEKGLLNKSGTGRATVYQIASTRAA